MAKSTTYNTSGNKEDLTSIISTLEPESTPFVSLMKKGKATGTFFEYQVDKLNSPEFGIHDLHANPRILKSAVKQLLPNYLVVYYLPLMHWLGYWSPAASIHSAWPV